MAIKTKVLVASIAAGLVAIIVLIINTGRQSRTTAKAIPEFSDVQTIMTLTPTTLSRKEVIRVTISMTNTRSNEVTFRYYPSFAMHIELLDGKGSLLEWGEETPAFICPYFEVRIGAGKTVSVWDDFELSEWYDVEPGNYVLRFKYDAKLLDTPQKKDQWIPWTANSFKITVIE